MGRPNVSADNDFFEDDEINVQLWTSSFYSKYASCLVPSTDISKRLPQSAGIFPNCDCGSLGRDSLARMKVYLARESKIPRLLELEADVEKLSRANSHWIAKVQRFEAARHEIPKNSQRANIPPASQSTIYWISAPWKMKRSCRCEECSSRCYLCDKRARLEILSPSTFNFGFYDQLKQSKPRFTYSGFVMEGSR